MNKQLAKKGTTLNKNMTNTDSLSLTDLQCTNASFTICTSNYMNADELMSSTLDIPIAIPTTLYAGTAYYNTATESLNIYNGTNWYHVTLTQVP